MERESQTEPEAATVTPLDQALWSVLTGEPAPAPFSSAWLALLCRMLPGAARAVLVLRQDGALAPIARWPDGDAGSAQLAHVAELALNEHRGVVSRPGGRPRRHNNDRRTSHLAFPLLFGGEDQGVVAVELDGAGDAALRDAMRQLQWGASWIELRQLRVQSAGDAARLRQGYAALEVAATALAADRFDAAARATATETALRLHASRVAIGWLTHRSIRIAGLSHAVGSGKRADATVALTAAMEEAVDQGASLLFPLPGNEPLPQPRRTCTADRAGWRTLRADGAADDARPYRRRNHRGA